MQTYIIKGEVNLYKLKDAGRRSGILDVNKEYSINTEIPDGIDDKYRVIVSEVGTSTDVVGWVNYKDFIDNSELIESASTITKDSVVNTEEDKDYSETFLEDNSSIDKEPEIRVDLANDEDKTGFINIQYTVVHVKRGITFDYDNKPTGHLPNNYFLLKEENGIAYVKNRASQQPYRFAVSSLDR